MIMSSMNLKDVVKGHQMWPLFLDQSALYEQLVLRAWMVILLYHVCTVS